MKTIGVVGLGTMGIGIAQVAASAGCQVRMYDAFPASLETAKPRLEKTLNSLAAKGKLTETEASTIAARLHPAQSLQEFADCDLVIEAIIENRDLKADLFRQLEPIVSPTCLLASNTSSLSIASLAASCTIPGRFIGIHFFNPASLMKLVEIIPAVQTEAQTLTLALETIRSWGKITVLAKDTPGFIVNRVARPFYGEALRILDEGIADMATIDWAMKAIGGFPMGPFELMDFIGHDVNFVVTETVFQAFYYDPRYMPSFSQKRLLEAGYLGRKSGKGFYDYTEGASRPLPTENPELGNTIVNRILAMLINEAAEALHYRIASANDIDLAMTKGVNYPMGLLARGKELGYHQVVAHLDHLFDTYHDPRYRCSIGLRKLAMD
jgi:3-hydroxybutyryl-CoA dehydrogenase